LINKSGYEYLLKLPVRTLTSNQVKKIKNDILSQEKKLDNIKKTSEKKMWLNDLKEFEDEYMKWLKNMDSLFEKKVVMKDKKKKKVVMEEWEIIFKLNFSLKILCWFEYNFIYIGRIKILFKLFSLKRIYKFYMVVFIYIKWK